MDIKRFIETLDVQTFVEVGAHFGIDTREFRKMHPGARIVCFEPDPRNLAVLKAEGVDKICELHALALSDANGAADFHLSTGDTTTRFTEEILRTHDWSCSSSLKEPTGHLAAHPWITFPSTVSVECVRLDDFAPLQGVKIDFMWVDVQGAEDLVFAGAQATLKNTRYLYSEYSDHQLYRGQLTLGQILALVGPAFRVVHVFRDDVLLENSQFVR